MLIEQPKPRIYRFSTYGKAKQTYIDRYAFQDTSTVGRNYQTVLLLLLISRIIIDAIIINCCRSCGIFWTTMQQFSKGMSNTIKILYTDVA
jgi:hypothetical protein